MNCAEIDRESLVPLRPLDIASYLRQQGWQRTDLEDGRASVWTLETRGNVQELLLPHDPQLGDYMLRLGDVVLQLAALEGRGPEAIIRDLTLRSSDVVRLKVESPGLTDGSVPMELGVRLVEQAQALMSAAACAALRPRALVPSRRPAEAADYLRRLRLGQTERGSYVLTIRSEVPPSLTGQLPLLPEADQPFERRVTITLARALEAARQATALAAGSSSVEHFGALVERGVSANLCDAVAGLVSDGVADRLEIRLSWAATRQAPAGLPTRFIFPSDTHGILREAARWFRETSPREDFELEGMVVALRRDEPSQPGRATIVGNVDGVLRKVQVFLEGEAYDQAIRAHRETFPIRLEGELIRENRVLVLRNTRGLTLETTT